MFMSLVELTSEKDLTGCQNIYDIWRLTIHVTSILINVHRKKT